MIVLTQHDGTQVGINTDLIRFIEGLPNDGNPATKTEVYFVGGMIRVQETFDEVYNMIQQRRKNK